MTSLPSVSMMSSSPSFRPYSSCQYTRNKVGINGEKVNIIPHPPPRQRPVSANPACGGPFQASSKKPTIAGNWTNGFLNCDNNAGAKALTSVIDLDMRLQETEEKLNNIVNSENESYKNLVNSENESYKKDCVIGSLREEIEYLRRSYNDSNRSSNNEPNRNYSDAKPCADFSTGCHEKISALHNQIQLKHDDNERLRAENETLRIENDSLRQTNNSALSYTENRNLREENEQLKISSNDVNRQLAELKVLLSQRDRQLGVLENDINRGRKEKSQQSMMVNTLQKEVTSKDELLRRSRAEVEKQKTELRTKQNEISTMAARLAKNSDYLKTRRELKQKDEEVGDLKYEMKSLEEKIVKKDEQIVQLNEHVDAANKNTSESESIYKHQIKNYQEKLRGKDVTVNDIKEQLSSIERSLAEYKGKERESNSIELAATENTSGVLCNIEKRLIKNGRSSRNLNKEIEVLRSFEASGNLSWVKECFLSSLCQEYNWEMEIEEALKSSMRGSTEQAVIPPAKQIRTLCEKVDDSLVHIQSLENQIKDVTESMKVKYKVKVKEAIREIKDEEKAKRDEEIQKLREGESKRVTHALNAQRDVIANDIGNLQEMKEVITALRDERDNSKIELELLQKEKEKRRMNENDYREKLEQSEKERQIYETIMESKVSDEVASKNKILEKLKSMEEQCGSLKEHIELKRCEINELKVIQKDEVDGLSEQITSLEYQVISLKHSKTTMEIKVDTLDELVKDYKGKEFLLKGEEENVKKLTEDVHELLGLNETLKSSLQVASNDCIRENETSREIREQLHTALANLSDLKGDLSDKEKQRIEHLEGKCSNQEKELMAQQIHLVKLSTLVDEQKMKLIEQDQQIKEQHEMLADRHIPWARKECRFHDEPTDYVTELKQIGQRCVDSRHEEVINEQNNAIKHMKHSLVSAPDALAYHHHKEQLEISSAIDVLKDELVAQERQSAVTDQKLYTEVCRLEERLIALNAELASEKSTHQNNLQALDQCEKVYLTFVREINKELDIEEILGASPLSFSAGNEREQILTERSKGLEVILNRIKSVMSRIERKDQLLESYDDVAQKYRETESFAVRKSYEVDNLQTELTESRTEVSYLQEALKKWRGECDDLRRQNSQLKQKKALDYNNTSSSPSPKIPKQKKSRHKQVVFEHSDTTDGTT